MKIEFTSEQFEKLIAISNQLNEEKELLPLLKMILEAAMDLTGSQGGTVYLIRKKKLYYYITLNRVLKLYDQRTPREIPFTDKSIAGYCGLKKKAVNIPDVYHIDTKKPYKWYGQEFDQKLNYKTTSMLTTPLVDSNKKAIGIIQLVNRTSKKGEVVTFHEGDIHLLEYFSSQAAISIKNTRMIEDLNNMVDGLIKYSAAAIDERSRHTAGHSRRVAHLAVLLALAVSKSSDGKYSKLRFTPDKMKEIWMAGWLHDIGKIGIPESILTKRKKLSATTDGLDPIRERRDKTILYNLLMDILKKNEFHFSPDDATKEQNKKVHEAYKLIKKANNPEEHMDDDCYQALLDTFKSSLTVKSSARNRTRLKRIRFLSEISRSTEKGLLKKEEIDILKIRYGNLTPKERNRINSHAILTEKIIRNIPLPDAYSDLTNYTHLHHEKLNGKGYPKGLRNKDVPIEARILAVADIFDALTAKDRPYNKPLPPKKAITILEKEVESGALDPEIVNIFKKSRVYKLVRQRQRKEFLLDIPKKIPGA